MGHKISHWRKTARAVVTQALADAAEHNLDEQQTRRLISSRYPFGQRQYHPYKIWLDEVKRGLAPAIQAAQAARPVFGGAIVDEHEYTISRAAEQQKVNE